MSNGFGNTEIICDLHKNSFGGMKEMQAQLERDPRKNEPELAEFYTESEMYQPTVFWVLSSTACPVWWPVPCLSTGHRSRP